jgi:hypothetical protein
MSEFGTAQLAKMAADMGLAPTLKKTFFREAIEARAEEIRLAGETKEGAFTKAITKDETGILLYAAMKRARGPEVEADAVEDDVKPQSKGPAHDKLQAMAELHHMKNQTKSVAESYTYLYTHPDNRALTARVRAEHLTPRMPAGGRLAFDYPENAETRSHGRNA